MSDSQMHKGHRQRLKARFREEGLDNFSEVQVLELLLFYAIPQKDTNPIAHDLIRHFGSVSQVLDASVEELTKVAGIGENAALLLKLVTEAGRYYLVNRSQQTTALTSLNACANYLVPRFFGRQVETVFLLCLDAKCKVLCCKEVGEGSVNSTSISIRRIVELALGANATSVVLAHNHPSGVAVPSKADMQTTQRLAAALEAVDIYLSDHVIVADDDYTSMVQSGYPIRE